MPNSCAFVAGLQQLGAGSWRYTARRFLCIDIYYGCQHNGPVYSTRFQRPVILTRHAIKRMAERIISESELLAVVDTGDTRFKDETHLWAFKHLAWRTDNLICAVLVLEDAVVVKTVMHDFTLET